MLFERLTCTPLLFDTFISTNILVKRAIVNNINFTHGDTSFMDNKPLTSYLLWTLITLLGISACSNIPEKIKQAPASNITPDEARQNPQTFKGQSIRWGGEVIQIDNKPEYTHIIVLAKPLDIDGQPSGDKPQYGRFIAQINRFVEPSLYATGRDVTVTGVFSNTHQQMIGEYPYQYPVVTVDTIYLWPLPVEPDPDYWYDPWYPWGGWHPWHPH